MVGEEIEKWLQRIRLGEDSTLEFKQVVWRGASTSKVVEPHADGLSDEMAAMANAAGGTILLGVADQTREVLGIPADRISALEDWLVSIASDRIEPPLEVQTRHIELPDRQGQLQPVILVSIPRSLWVHQSANGYFRRIGHSKRIMSPEVLARLFQQRSQARIVRFEEQAVPATSRKDLDSLLAGSFVREGEADLQLRRLHFIVDAQEQEHLSVAGVLMATREPSRWLPSAYIQAVAYRGSLNDPAEQFDARDFHGPLYQQVWDAFYFARLYNRVAASKGLGRVDRPQYSLRAIFEAIVNAVAHRDYSITGGRIRLHIFSDRIELYSPGALPNSMSIESMTSLSLPRNELIASLFSRYCPVHESGLGREFLMDRRGAGVDIIFRESERLSGKRPLYENLNDIDLRLTLFPAWESNPG